MLSSIMLDATDHDVANGEANNETINSTTTWPKAHLSQRTLSDLQYRIQLERAINAAKLSMCMPKNTVADTRTTPTDTVEFNRIKARLLDTLEKVRDTKNQQMLAKAGRRTRVQKAGAKPQQPHFGSMIISGTLQQKEGASLRQMLEAAKKRPSFRRRSISILSDSTIKAKAEEEEAKLEEMKLLEAEEPFFLRYCPLFTTLLFAVLIIVMGAVLFKTVDEQIGQKPFQNVLTFCFQALGTIGWGDVRAGSKWGQLLCTFYTLFGVPMFFSALANAGRALVSEFFTIDWIFLTCVVRPRRLDEPVVNYHMPLVKAVHWLIVHQFVGLLLYGELFKHYRPIETLYFCLTSMGTIGIGDFHPDAANVLEAAVAIVFLGSGIGLLAALMIGIAYHFQSLFFITLRAWLLKQIRTTK
uniref:Ion_trans_2 domain-containing protein n=1 Tax=Globodera pallida TaxID=36090 RepID=A0A183BLR0_GLOPA